MNANGGCCVCARARDVQPEFVRSRIYIFNSASYQTDNLKTVYNIAMDFALDASKQINLFSAHTHTEKRWNLMHIMVRCVAPSAIWNKVPMCLLRHLLLIWCAMCTRYEIFFWHCIEQQTFKCLNMDVGSLMENRDLLTDRICCNDANARAKPYTSRRIQTIRYMIGVKKIRCTSDCR